MYGVIRKSCPALYVRNPNPRSKGKNNYHSSEFCKLIPEVVFKDRRTLDISKNM